MATTHRQASVIYILPNSCQSMARIRIAISEKSGHALSSTFRKTTILRALNSSSLLPNISDTNQSMLSKDFERSRRQLKSGATLLMSTHSVALKLRRWLRRLECQTGECNCSHSPQTFLQIHFLRPNLKTLFDLISQKFDGVNVLACLIVATIGHHRENAFEKPRLRLKLKWGNIRFFSLRHLSYTLSANRSKSNEFE